MSTEIDKIIGYYHTKESKWGYKLILGGTKHFGYYPQSKNNISIRQAMLNMIDRLGKTIDLPPQSLVLDAGCGEGATALRLASKFKYNVEGIDLLDFNIKSANTKLQNSKLKDKVHFKIGNYLKIDYPDNTFDAVFTMETLVHAPDYKKALREFRRVLKKNGKLVLFEYSIPKQEDLNDSEMWVFRTIAEGSAMHSFQLFSHGSFPKILKEAGFTDIKVTDITVNMIPMLKRFWQIGVIPYQLIKLFKKEKHFVNTTSGVELYKHRDKFRYNIISAIAR